MVNQHNCWIVLACTSASNANVLALTITTDASLSGCRMILLGRKANSMWSQQLVHLRYMIPVPLSYDMAKIWPGRYRSLHLNAHYFSPCQK